MPTYRAVANGNWSSLATWQDNSTGSYVASTQLPGVNDDVYANNFVVQVDQSISVKSLRNAAAFSISNGGRFEVSTSQTVTTSDGIFGATSSFATNIASNACLYIKTAGITVTVNSNCTGGGGNFCNAISCDVAATVNVTGNQTGGGGSLAAGISSYNNPTWNITGNQTGAGGAGINVLSGTSTWNIIGNQSSSGISGGAVIMNITGNQTSGAATAINLAVGGSTVTITGVCTASSTVSAISSAQATNQIIYNGSVYNTLGVNAIYAQRLFLNINPATEYRFYDLSGTINTLYPAGAAAGNPIPADVRDGVVYANGSLTGTLAVPSPSNVRKGVATDNTIGTAELTAQDLFDAIAASSDPVAVRLRNVSTVETTGDQIAAFNI